MASASTFLISFTHFSLYMLYIVTYDLNTTGQRYTDLITAIKKMDYCPLLKSAWLVKSSSSAKQIYDYLLPIIDSNDHLLVAEINSNRMGWLDKEAVAFMK